jgi:hypothetical protein
MIRLRRVQRRQGRAAGTGEPAAGGWIKVRHRDGLTGYVKNSEVWGI